MLQNLHVKNLALIDEAEVDFSEGLNILSGETGAGKSIIIGSIGLALGERASKELIRQDADYALVELVFSVDSMTRKKLEDMDIPMDDDQVILTRRISGGRPVAKINSETVSTSKLKEVSGLLIDIHGQHEHQSLLNQKNHLEILDLYAKKELKELKEELADVYRSYTRVKKEYDQSVLDEDQRARELSFLEFEQEEIQNARLRIGEDEELESQFRKYSNRKKIMEKLSAAYQLTSASGASDLTGRALRELSQVSQYDSLLEQLEDQLSELDNLLNDFNREVSGYMDEAEFNEEEFYEIEKRLDLINGLKAKYGDSIEKILEEMKEKEERILQLRNYDEYLAGLREKIHKFDRQLEVLSAQVSKIRKDSAVELTEKIKSALIDLNFLEVGFEMRFTQKEGYSLSGYDEVEFLISTNPGQPLKPLTKIVSGGELSRIMLAIKAVLADCDQIGSLIFDEIDTGISGRTAQKVSEKMNLISRKHQVICITHLPQIAAMADRHFLIEKQPKDHQTVTEIRPLTEEERVEELGRMLGGVEITDTVLESAREMQKLAVAAKKRL